MKRIWNGILPILGMLVPLAIPHVAASGPYAPTVQLSWDQCDPIVRNRNFSEPGIYTIVLVGTQFDTPVLGTEAEIQFRGTTGVPDAWRFEEGGCNLAQLSISAARVSPDCPALAGANAVPLVQAFHYPGSAVGWHGPYPDTSYLHFWIVFDASQPTYETPYTVVQLQFDHSRSAAGPTVPGESCGDADKPVCVFLQWFAWIDGANDLHETSAYWPYNYLTWNDPSETNGCPVTASRATTWGQIKAAYR